MSELPGWLVSSSARPRHSRPTRAGGYVGKTLARLSRVWQDAIFSERMARRPGWLQTWNPRPKVACFLGLVVVGTLLHHALPLWAFAACVFAGGLSSRVGPKAFLSPNSWIASLIALALAVPAAFSFVVPGDSLYVLTRWPIEVTITRQGLHAGLMLFSRVTLYVLIMTVLTLTTRWQDLLGGLRGLGIPSVFVLTLGLTYRYLFLLLRLVEAMHNAKRSRSLRAGAASQERGWAAGRIAALFSRSRPLSEKVYL